MRRDRNSRGFALFEVLIGLTIFVVGTLTLGRAVENCLNATALSAQEDRVRQILGNRMADIQATPGFPETSPPPLKIETGYGLVVVTQKTKPAGLKNEKDIELAGINLVTLTAEWTRGRTKQTRDIAFYVYRAG